MLLAPWAALPAHVPTLMVCTASPLTVLVVLRHHVLHWPVFLPREQGDYQRSYGRLTNERRCYGDSAEFVSWEVPLNSLRIRTMFRTQLIVDTAHQRSRRTKSRNAASTGNHTHFDGHGGPSSP
jgi:hypothetical protein